MKFAKGLDVLSDEDRSNITRYDTGNAILDMLQIYVILIYNDRSSSNLYFI